MELHREMKQRELEDRGAETTQAAAAARRAFGSNCPWRATPAARRVGLGPGGRDRARRTCDSAARLVCRWTGAGGRGGAGPGHRGQHDDLHVYHHRVVQGPSLWFSLRQLVALATADVRGPLPDAPGPRRDGVSWADFQDWRAASRTFRRNGCRQRATMNPGATVGWPGARAVPRRRLFRATRLDIACGSKARCSDAGCWPTTRSRARRRCWSSDTECGQGRYDGDPAVVGRTARRQRDVPPRSSSAMMPADFRYPDDRGRSGQPLALSCRAGDREARCAELERHRAPRRFRRRRRRPAADLFSAIASSGCAGNTPETNARQPRATVAAADGSDPARARSRFSPTLMGAVGFRSCWIACANVATLLLAPCRAPLAAEIAIRALAGRHALAHRAAVA